MKEITDKELKALPMSENHLHFESIGEFIYNLEDIFTEVEAFSDEMLENVMHFLEDQDVDDWWFIRINKSTYIQFKPSDGRLDPHIVPFVGQCLEIMVHKNTSGNIPNELKSFKI